MNFLQGHGTNVMDSAAFSADVSPIEHIWDELGRRVRNRVPPPAASDTYTRMEQYSTAETLCGGDVGSRISSSDGHTRY